MEPIQLETRDNRTILHLRGDIDVRIARDLAGAAMRADQAGTDVAVDWKETDRIDTSAVQILIALKTAVRRSGRSFFCATEHPAIAVWLTAGGLREEATERVTTGCTQECGLASEAADEAP